MPSLKCERPLQIVNSYFFVPIHIGGKGRGAFYNFPQKFETLLPNWARWATAKGLSMQLNNHQELKYWKNNTHAFAHNKMNNKIRNKTHHFQKSTNSPQESRFHGCQHFTTKQTPRFRGGVKHPGLKLCRASVQSNNVKNTSARNH